MRSRYNPVHYSTLAPDRGPPPMLNFRYNTAKRFLFPSNEWLTT